MLTSMRNRMVLLVLLMIVVLTLTVAFIALRHNYNSASEMAERYNRQLALDAMESLDIKNRKYGEVSLQIVMSSYVQEQLPRLLEAEKDESEFLAFKTGLTEFLQQYYYTSDEIESIRVWFGDKAVSVGEPRLKKGGYEEQAGYQAAKANPAHLAWTSSTNRTMSQWHVITSFHGKLGPNNGSANPVIGAVEINMKPQRLLESIDKLKVIPGVRLSYVNRNGELLFRYPEDDEELGERAGEDLALLEAWKKRGGEPQTEVAGFSQGGHAFFIERSYLGMHLIIAYPVQTFTEYVSVAGRQVALIALVVLLLSVLGVAYISHMTTRPLRIVLEGIGKFGEGRLEEKIRVTGVREIDRIGRGLNRMARQIQQLLDSQVGFKQKEHDLELKSKQAELKALRNQINPHFLFNTLQSIHSVALRKTGKETEINRMILHLSKLLRESIYQIGNNVTLENELNNLWAYVELQQYRFKGKFYVKWELDYFSLSQIVPCLILQPIMENAIYHGASSSERDCVLIVVRSGFDERELVLEVRDEGIGMEPETLERLRESLAEGREPAQGSGGVGLINTHHRLKHEFGQSYAMTIDSIPHVGTTVRIVIRTEGSDTIGNEGEENV
ncbi:sensor histidine kinase [Cohnella sp. LGH]|uniref:sensor histidine kinase n=1 Tax=Cohnella sp. LGH TaxID=1619153 RepID=UPI001AD96D33|nr:sensor histidine kinase [Cohnella sp. LGH]QTH40095.1 sensor histidine kinase [Cohnella sp. LGH]